MIKSTPVYLKNLQFLEENLDLKQKLDDPRKKSNNPRPDPSNIGKPEGKKLTHP